MTRPKQKERTLWEGVVDEDVRAFWEAWMVEADKLLEDEELIDSVHEAQGGGPNTVRPQVVHRLRQR